MKEPPRDFHAGEIVWNAVYTQAPQELKDAMDLAYLIAQRPADVLKASATDINKGSLMVGQGKTQKRLRILLRDGVTASDLSAFLDDLLDRKAIAGIKSSNLITNQAGLRMSYAMLRNRWDEARDAAATKAAAEGDPELAATIRKFQFRDIRPNSRHRRCLRPAWALNSGDDKKRFIAAWAPSSNQQNNPHMRNTFQKMRNTLLF
ncbi:MAG: integrase [Candidatus Pseudomonas colombiensis]|uniref:Integrase n=1 Tax=Pseudomonas morbosilactucae TaxID=2938197 RepID=A0ABT0JQY4_9PSED|nr:integrase [Pseudomonas morbosilactucae]MCK9818154.1 integrase [Pseudomonas morbosilactucae]WEK07563.1 MAG: integrase [Pseudomonas sp.]